jgi:hypothetical protein
MVIRDYTEIENLIYQSVRESKLFDGEWESILYSNLLRMIITKGGGVEEFITHFQPHMDIFDFDEYFKDDLVDRYGKDGYQLLVDFILGDGDDETE